MRFDRHYKSSKVQTLFVHVIYEDQVLYANPKKRGPFRKNKTPLQMLFQIVFLNTRYLLAYYYSNQINKLLNNKEKRKKNRSDTKSFSL